MRRLALLILTLLLALPAIAAPACAPGAAHPAAHAAHGNPAKPDPAAAPAIHGCIGCATPTALTAPPIGAAIIPAPVLSAPRLPTLVGRSLLPETPPPRRSA